MTIVKQGDDIIVTPIGYSGDRVIDLVTFKTPSVFFAMNQILVHSPTYAITYPINPIFLIIPGRKKPKTIFHSIYRWLCDYY